MKKSNKNYVIIENLNFHRKMLRTLLFALIFGLSTLVLADEKHNNKCNIDPNVMVSIMMNEAHPEKQLGYPYIISLNNLSDVKIVRNFYGNFFLDKRTLDCKNSKTCVEITSVLLKSGIINMDLGPFQINPKFHDMPIENYFDIKKSYNKACSYVQKLVNKYGYGWYAIASYHSQTEKYNYRYQRKLIENYQKIKD
jgi:hypothetical protein